MRFQVALMIPYTAPLGGMNIIADYPGITREVLAAPVRRAGTQQLWQAGILDEASRLIATSPVRLPNAMPRT